MGRNNRRKSGKKGSKSRNGRLGSLQVVRAIQDLKVATAKGPSLQVVDIPKRIFRRERTYSFRQTCSYASFGLSMVTQTAGAVAIALSNFPNASAFESLFDQYRFEQITVRFVPQGKIPLSTGNFSPLITVLDYDDAATPSSLQYVQSYDNAQETPIGDYVERTLVPRLAVALYSGTAFTSYGSARQWVDCNSDTVPWYGVKYWVSLAGANITNFYSIEVEADLSFRHVR